MGASSPRRRRIHEPHAATLALPLLLALGAPCHGATAATGLPEQLRTTTVTSTRGMAVSGSPQASRAGAEILEAGGNAVDAAVAAALALGVAEPGQSGLGGQTYMLICWPGGACVAIDGSSVAPLRVSRPALQRLATEGRLFGYELVATPTTLATLALALQRYGTLTLAQAIVPAIAIADAGSPFSQNQRNFAGAYVEKIRENRYLSDLVLADGIWVRPLEHVYCNADLERTLRRLAADGAGAFYTGEIAAEIAADMAANGGWVTQADLARVRPVERAPLRGSFRGFEVVSFPFPGGGAAVIETLHILEGFAAGRLAGGGADSRMLEIEAARLAIADEHAVRRPSAEAQAALLDKGMASRRAALIRFDRALAREEISVPAPEPWLEKDTTQLTVADAAGTVVSVTQTLGHGFGACVATPGLGFPYNSMLEAFDLEHSDSRSYLLPLRTPYTSQAPTVLLRDGRPVLALGGVGSARITSSVAGVIVNVVDRGMTLHDAIVAPRVVWGDSPENMVNVEVTGAPTAAVADELQRRGYPTVKRVTFPAVQQDLGWLGGINAVAISPDGSMSGVGDPRRQGAAAAPDKAPPR
jgi:gamma-glutamyltranspeptidase / glutathione hydrolase